MNDTRRKPGVAVFAIALALAGIGYFAFHSLLPLAKAEGRKPTANRVLEAYREIRRVTIETMGPPRAITTDHRGRTYIVAGTRVYQVLPNEKVASVLIELEEEVSCITTSPEGMIYLGVGTHVEVFDGGTQRGTWSDLSHDAIITSIAVTNDRVFVADAGGRRVWRYDTTGKLLGWITGGGREAMHFILPSPYFDLSISHDGFLWVTNPGRHRVEAYSYEGESIRSWGRSSGDLAGFQGCCNPSHIAVLPDGSVVTSEKGLTTIEVYSPEGEWIALVADHRRIRVAGIGLDVACDSEGRIYVLDPKLPGFRVYERRG